jgi:uncharacterized protein YneF (UPF0154 family)
MTKWLDLLLLVAAVLLALTVGFFLGRVLCEEMVRRIVP